MGTSYDPPRDERETPSNDVMNLMMKEMNLGGQKPEE
jgi:hypothetical protein